MSGKLIRPGDYCYKAYSNPVRLSPTGRDRALVSECTRNVADFLPYGSLCVQVPVMPELIKQQLKQSEAMQSKELKQTGQLLLKGGTFK